MYCDVRILEGFDWATALFEPAFLLAVREEYAQSENRLT